jgi:hypothetical protein
MTTRDWLDQVWGSTSNEDAPRGPPQGAGWIQGDLNLRQALPALCPETQVRHDDGLLSAPQQAFARQSAPTRMPASFWPYSPHWRFAPPAKGYPDANPNRGSGVNGRDANVIRSAETYRIALRSLRGSGPATGHRPPFFNIERPVSRQRFARWRGRAPGHSRRSRSSSLAQCSSASCR